MADPHIAIEYGTVTTGEDAGQAAFFVSCIDVEGGSLCLSARGSYDQAIADADEASRDWKLPVIDKVVPDHAP